MKKWFTGALAAAVLLGLALPRPTAADITPEQLAELRKLFQEARSLYQEKKYAESTAAYEQLLTKLPAKSDPKNDPDRAAIHYDIAKNHALLNTTAKAFDHLTKSIGFGWDNDEIMQKDVDLTALWTDKRFLKLVESIQKKKKDRLQGVAALPIGLRDLDGKTIAADDLKGKVVILDVWGTWCPPCRMEIPHFVDLQKKYGKDGFEVIGLTWEKVQPTPQVEERVRKFAKKNNVNYRMTMLPADRLSSIPDLRGFPTTYFIGRDQTVRKKMVGYHSYADLEKQVKPLLAEKAPKAKKK